MNENWLLNNNNQTYKYVIHVFNRRVKHLLSSYTCYCSSTFYGFPIRFIALLYCVLLSYTFNGFPIRFIAPILCIAILFYRTSSLRSSDLFAASFRWNVVWHDPRWANNSTQMAQTITQHCSKLLKMGPTLLKMAQRCSNMFQNCPTLSQNCPTLATTRAQHTAMCQNSQNDDGTIGRRNDSSPEGNLRQKALFAMVCIIYQ